MRQRLAGPVVVGLTGLVALAGCSGSTPAAEPQTPSAAPATTGTVPIPSGTVATRGPVSVVQRTGEEPQVCLGLVEPTKPPTCTGTPVTGWDWAARPGSRESGGTRWGSYALTGTWDGTTYAVTAAVPAVSYDAGPSAPETTPPIPTRAFTRAGLREIADEASSLPGALGTRVDDRRVEADVVYDDGTIQDYADRAWGRGVVVVTSALVNAT